jgi:hypothetical protein
MKYCSFFLIFFILYGCSNPAGKTAKKISQKVQTCCSAISLSSSKKTASIPTLEKELAQPIQKLSVSVVERTGQILTW